MFCQEWENNQYDTLNAAIGFCYKRFKSSLESYKLWGKCLLLQHCVPYQYLEIVTYLRKKEGSKF